MKTSSWISFVSLAMAFAFLITVDDLIADEPTTPTSIRLAAGKAEADEAQKTIRWSVLAPENGKPFNDPFAKLTQNQLADLGYVVRVQGLIAENKIKADGVDAKEAAELARKLTTEGVDIGWLMAQRERVQQIRGLQVEDVAKSIAKFLGDQEVTLTGYVIPIKMSQKRLTEFFLVPTTAACSHEDAPPRLQVVFVASEQGIAPPDRRTPVRVTGKVVAETTTRTTFNGNGQVEVHSAYAMSSPEINVFQATKKSRNPSKQ
jgi:hypothetical protein